MLKSILSLIVLFLFISCSEDFVSVEEPENSDISVGVTSFSRLEKTVWFTSAVLDWPYYSYWDVLYGQMTAPEDDYYFTFRNYNYHLNYNFTPDISGNHNCKIKIYVNNTLCSELNWTVTDDTTNPRWLGWHSFSYNGISMQLNIYVDEYYIPMWNTSRPEHVQVKVLGFATERPNFSVTPYVNNNTKPVLSWSTNDPDVTGFEIEKCSYSLVNGQAVTSGFKPLLTVTNPGPGTYTDIKVFWSDGTRGMIGIIYRCRTVYANNGGVKSAFEEVYCYMPQYDYLLP